jgi:2-C-methyl-D-erythritol 4-phosphate cytidylyltransferase
MNLALIVAAGRGFRVGGPMPKQYLPLAGVPILRHTIENFLAHPQIHAVQVLIHPNDLALYQAATAGLSLRPPLSGGAERQDSVRLGLEGLAELNPATVLIHDAVRPFTSHATITAVLEALAAAEGAIAAVPLVDTLKRGAAGHITGTIPREGLFRAQTPQGFRYPAIRAAHQAAANAGDGITDDAMVAERAGLKIRLVDGDEDNFKITTAADLHRAESLLRHRQNQSQNQNQNQETTP